MNAEDNTSNERQPLLICSMAHKCDHKTCYHYHPHEMDDIACKVDFCNKIREKVTCDET